MNVAVFGLGKLGQPMAVVLARAGHQVVAYDIEETVRHEVSHHRATVDEPMLAEEMAELGTELVVSGNIEAAVQSSEVGYVIVPTPSTDDGTFSNKYVLDVVAGIGQALKGRTGHYTVVICSTVMPGSTAGDIAGTLAHNAERPFNEGVDGISLVYSPQFIALGSVLHDMRNPDVFLVGTESTKAYMRVEEIAKTVFEDPDSVHVAWLPHTEAEIVKIGINTYITMKISFANALGWACANVPGVDGYRVTRTIGQDSRIGSKYIMSGGPYGGPCFPRDTDAFAAFVREATGTDNWAGLAIETAGLNDDIIKFTVKTAVAAANHESHDRESSILLLGTGYKPASSVTEESFAFRVAEALEHEVTSMGLEFEIFGHDPNADVPWGVSRLTEGAAEAKAARDDVVTIICSPEPQFAQMTYSTVVDVWGIVPDANADTLINYRGGNGAHLLTSR